jgi:DNA-directed RNA polymerase subunit RPC12/RpoP
VLRRFGGYSRPKRKGAKSNQTQYRCSACNMYVCMHCWNQHHLHRRRKRYNARGRHRPCPTSTPMTMVESIFYQYESVSPFFGRYHLYCSESWHQCATTPNTPLRWCGDPTSSLCPYRQHVAGGVKRPRWSNFTFWRVFLIITQCTPFLGFNFSCKAQPCFTRV